MRQLVRKTDSSRRARRDLSKKLAEVKSLSGQQILEALVVIADEADRLFTPDLFDNFWKPVDGNYSRFIRDIAASFGLNERALYHPHEPFSSYNKHHFPTKRNLAKLFPHLQVVDPSLLARTGDDEELLLVSYHIWHSISSSSSYFNSRSVSRLHELYLRLRGVQEETEVKEEVVNALKPHQINPSQTPLEILTDQPRDIFEYKLRLFTLPQKLDDCQQNDGELVDIIWAFGVYTRWPEPIGYVLFNEQLKDRKKLFLPDAR